MSLEFGSQAASAFTNFCNFRLQFGVTDHRLDIAQFLVPVGEFRTRQRPTLTARTAPLSTFLTATFLRSRTRLATLLRLPS